MFSFKNYLPYYKSSLRLAVPVIISQVGQLTVQLVDTGMVGRLGATQLAAVSFANSIAMPIILFGMGVAMGLTPLVGRANSRGDFARVSSLFKNSLMINTILALAMMMVIAGFSIFMPLMGQDPEILPIAQNYIMYMVASAIPIMIFSSCRQLLEGLGNTTYTMVITISGNILNVILNFALIYGLWGFPEMGAVGAGASTFIARTLMMAAFLLLLIKKETYSRYLKYFSQVPFCIFRQRRLLNIGVPIAMQIFIEMVAMSLMAIVVGTFGATALAAHQIAINIPSLSYMVVVGLGAATTIRVSQDYGLRLYKSMYMSLKAALHLIIAYMLVSAIAIFCLAEQIASIFTLDPAVIKMASHFLFFGALFQLSDGIQGIMLGGLRGILVVKQPMFYALGIYILFAIPLGYFLSFQWGVGSTGPWIAFITALSIFAVLYYRLFMRRYRAMIATK